MELDYRRSHIILRRRISIDAEIYIESLCGGVNIADGYSSVVGNIFAENNGHG